ncbi:MAG: tyrosine-type recombinase/integrase [Acidimicrobiia bacterium]|nr:tyrosine-type recombinase/integrase [Acidimicrobiia bacterium]
MNHDGTVTRRLDRHASARIIRRLATQAGIEKRIARHSLRHSFITAAVDAGVPTPRRPRSSIRRRPEDDHAL